MKFSFKNFINITKQEAGLVLNWRNSDRIRLKMINKDIIPLENHLKFIESLKTRKDCEYYLVYTNDNPIGVVDYTEIVEKESCTLGSYLGDTNFQQFGIMLLYFQQYFYFKNNPFAKAYSEVLKVNKEVYFINKRILQAKDISQDEEKYCLYFDKETFDKTSSVLKKTPLFPCDLKDIDFEIIN